MPLPLGEVAERSEGGEGKCRKALSVPAGQLSLVVADSACSRPYSKEYALSLTPSLLLSAQNRRFALDFVRGYGKQSALSPLLSLRGRPKGLPWQSVPPAAAVLAWFIYTRPPPSSSRIPLARGHIHKGHALSLTPSLLLSAQNRRFALDFVRALTEKRYALSIRGVKPVGAIIVVADRACSRP